MRKLLFAIVAAALCACALAGCSLRGSSGGGAQPTAEAAFEPETTALPEARHGEEDQSKVIGELPTLPPAETVEPSGESGGEDIAIPSSADEAEYFSIDSLLTGTEGPDAGFDSEHVIDPDETARPASESVPIIDPSTYQFSALTDTTLGFTFNYPTRWENLPGVFTVCFREAIEPGKFPARVAVSAKKLVHTAEGNVVASQLTSFMRTIYQMYDPATFQPGTANENDTFLGRPALSNTYLAYYGDIEVKGFIIGTAVEKTVYVFHFCASYEDYTAMEGIMRYMLNSVELVKR